MSSVPFSTRTGIANLPLHYGKAPRWLFDRMVKLAREITIAIVTDFSPEEMLQQPLWDDLSQIEAEAKHKDDLYDQAVTVVREHNRASVSLLQRRLRIGYSRAARLIDNLEEDGLIGPAQSGGRGREVLRPEQGGLPPN